MINFYLCHLKQLNAFLYAKPTSEKEAPLNLPGTFLAASKWTNFTVYILTIQAASHQQRQNVKQVVMTFCVLKNSTSLLSSHCQNIQEPVFSVCLKLGKVESGICLITPNIFIIFLTLPLIIYHTFFYHSGFTVNVQFVFCHDKKFFCIQNILGRKVNLPQAICQHIFSSLKQ